jgi:NAD-dependent SIR2 family protein deacetylase
VNSGVGFEKRRTRNNMNTIECPFCHGEINSDARKCKHCGEWVKEKSSSHNKNDERVACSSCGKKMIPRIITGPPVIRPQNGWTPVPKKSVCPFCAATYQKFPMSFGEKLGLAVFGVVALFVLIAILGK